MASNVYSLAEAYAAVASKGYALPFGIYLEDRPVGFLMIGYYPDLEYAKKAFGEEDEIPDYIPGSYLVWRFMIDQEYQGKGYGREAKVVSTIAPSRTKSSVDHAAVIMDIVFGIPTNHVKNTSGAVMTNIITTQFAARLSSRIMRWREHSSWLRIVCWLRKATTSQNTGNSSYL